jgi:hypothetical protein
VANNQMLEIAEAEVRRLRAELEKTPAYKRLKAAEELIATYRGNPEIDPPQKASIAEKANSEKAAAAQLDEMIGKPRQTKTAQVEAAAVEYLAHKGRRATSGEILPAVVSKGIDVPGKVPSKTLSSYLSNSKRFDNVPGFGGYGLVEWNGRRTAPPSTDAEQPAVPSNGLFN